MRSEIWRSRRVGLRVARRAVREAARAALPMGGEGVRERGGRSGVEGRRRRRRVEEKRWEGGGEEVNGAREYLS